MPDNLYPRALEVAVVAAREAGQLLRVDLYRPGGPRGSGDHAEADEEAEALIRERLLAAFPWNYLGEELGAHGDGAGDHIWLVDPNDGTRAYLKGWRGSAVSIAALRDGVPVLGVVYAFASPDGGGDLIAWAEGCPLTRNGRPVENRLDNVVLQKSSLVFVSQDADRSPADNMLCVRPGRYVILPSIAYRLARVAAGDGVAGVSLSHPGAWDYAAGHALLRAVGGTLVNEMGQEVKYSAQGRSSTRSCFGGAPAAVRELWQRDWASVLGGALPPPPYTLAHPVRGRVITDDGRLARAQGCLLGQLAGDSLGGLVEFRSVEEIRQAYPHGCRDLADGGTFGNLAGQPTDDSEMALMLARTLVANGTYDPAATRDAYRHWLDTGPFDVGHTTRLALAHGQPNPESQANGCLMRISPLGIFGAGRPDQAADWARQDSRLTHPHSVCADSCAVYTAAIATAIAAGGSKEDCFAAALKEADRSGVGAEVRQRLEAARSAPPADYETHMGWVLIALQNAFYQLLHATSLEEGIVDTVMRGGDTDTNAAIAGALLGAVHGRPAVAERWVRALLSCRPLKEVQARHPRPIEFWPVDALELAEALLALVAY